MQLIDLGKTVEYIDIDVSKIPYTFSVRLRRQGFIVIDIDKSRIKHTF